MAKKTDKRQIYEEMARLKAQFGEVSPEKLEVVSGLIEEAAFLKVEMAKLKAKVAELGAVDEMPQGDYSILRESPYAKQYESMLKLYKGILSELKGMLPKEVPADETEQDDGFDEFVERRA